MITGNSRDATLNCPVCAKPYELVHMIQTGPATLEGVSREVPLYTYATSVMTLIAASRKVGPG